MSARSLLTIVLALACIAYVLCRALMVGITYDEVWTLREFVPQTYFQIWSYESCDANNHLLNTVFIKTLFKILPNTLFVARLPNVLASLVYVWFSWKLCSDFKNWKAPIAFAVLLFNPFLLEFFSLARGYGLALGFTMGALYYLTLFGKQQSQKALVLELLFLALALISSFSILHLVLAILACNLIYIFRKNSGFDWRHYLPLFVFVMVMTAVLYVPITRLKQSDSLYYGGETGFYTDTLLSLAKYYGGSMVSGWEIKLILNIFLIAVGGAIILLLSQTNKLQSPGIAILTVLALSICSLYAQYYLLGNLFLIDRTAVFFYPLFFITFIYGWHLYSANRIRQAMIICVLIGVSSNFLRLCNVTHTSIWFFDAKSKELVKTIFERESDAKARVQCSWVLRKSMEYYREAFYPNLEIGDLDTANSDQSHQYYVYLNAFIDKVDYQKGKEKVFSLNRRLIKEFSPYGIELYEISPSAHAR